MSRIDFAIKDEIERRRAGVMEGLRSWEQGFEEGAAFVDRREKPSATEAAFAARISTAGLEITHNADGWRVDTLRFLFRGEDLAETLRSALLAADERVHPDVHDDAILEGLQDHGVKARRHGTHFRIEDADGGLIGGATLVEALAKALKRASK